MELKIYNTIYSVYGTDDMEVMLNDVTDDIFVLFLG